MTRRKFPKLVLYRRPQEFGQPTLGSFLWEPFPGMIRHLLIRCIELPWENNKNSVSCIPPGEYDMQFTMSTRFKRKMWQIMDVPGRAGIRIHAGNYLKDTEGCPLPCLQWHDLNADGVVDGSRSREATEALERFLKQYESDGLRIEIKQG